MIPDFGESDVLHLNLPLKAILSTSLKNHNFPVWTPFLSSGFPLLAEGQIGTFYLPNLLLFRFLPVVTAYNLNLALSYYIAALGMYLLCRKLKFTFVTSLITSFVFVFSGFFSTHLNHFNLIQAASLLPLIFWAFLLLWQKNTLPYVVLFAFFLSQQIFTGHFYIVFITLVGLLIFILCIIFNSNRKDRIKFVRERIGYGLLSIFGVFAFSAIQLLPTIELWQYSGRSTGLDFETVTSYPFPIKHVLSFINPYYFGSPRDGSYPVYSSDWGIFWENTGYIGVVPLILALISIFFIKEKIVLSAWIIFISSLLLVTGKYSPLYFIFSFPFFNLFRVPSKYLLLVVFSLSLLAGITFNKIISNSGKISKIVLIVLLFISIGIDEYRFSYDYPPVSEAAGWSNEPEILKLLPEKQSGIASIGSVNLWNSVFLIKGWQDIKPYFYFRNSLYPNYNAVFSLPTPLINTGGLIPRRSALFHAMIKDIEVNGEKATATPSAISRNALNLAGVRYLISPYSISGVNVKKLGEVNYENDKNILPLSVYLNEKARNQSYISFKSYKVTTKEEVVEKFNSLEFLTDNSILVENDDMIIDRNKNASGSSEIVFRSDTSVSLKTSSTDNGILVLTDTNYPGWQAYIDENPVPVKTVNLAQKGILLPKGEHKVIFRFYPKSFEVGKVITIVSFVTGAGALFLSLVFYSRKDSDIHAL